MFCGKCGAKLRDDAQFCQKCGTPFTKKEAVPQKAPQEKPPSEPESQPVQQVVYQTVYQPVYQPQPRPYYPPGTHPYHRLGGFLMFTVVMNTIGGIIGILSTILTGYAYIRIANTYFRAESYLHGISMFWIFSFLGSMFLMLYSTIVMFSFASKIRDANDNFLGYIQTRSLTLLFVSGGFYLTEFIWIKSYSLTSSSNFSKSMGQILLWAGVWIASLIFCSVYFGCSVRVRTYMGSDAYLRNSLFNKNTVSPIPADGSDQLGVVKPSVAVSFDPEKQWYCTQCGRVNENYTPTCYCGMIKPSGDLSQSWICKNCGRYNMGNLNQCYCCGNAKHREIPGWICHKCGYRNNENVKECRVCYTSRPD